MISFKPVSDLPVWQEWQLLLALQMRLPRVLRECRFRTGSCPSRIGIWSTTYDPNTIFPDSLEGLEYTEVRHLLIANTPPPGWLNLLSTQPLLRACAIRFTLYLNSHSTQVTCTGDWFHEWQSNVMQTGIRDCHIHLVCLMVVSRKSWASE